MIYLDYQATTPLAPEVREVLASGRDPGPYTATYDLVVRPRPPFWAWPPPPIAAMLIVRPRA